MHNPWFEREIGENFNHQRSQDFASLPELETHTISIKARNSELFFVSSLVRRYSLRSYVREYIRRDMMSVQKIFSLCFWYICVWYIQFMYCSDMTEKKALQNFLDTISSKYPVFMKYFAVIEKACDFALKAHTGQKRKYSGEPFITHPLNVALLCAKRFDDIDLLVASILHDCAEDNKDVKLSAIYKLFGEQVGFIVDSVTDTTDHFLHDPKHIFNDRIEKFLYGGMQDIRCIILKLHDREHNINTLGGLEPSKQIRMSFETQAIYEPLKKLFGFNKKKPQSLAACKDLLHHYLSAHRITTSEELKETLLNQTFFDFDNDTFNLVYKNSNHIFRKIDNKKIFEKLIQSKNFDEKIDVISIQWSDDGKFSVIFKYKWWNVFEDLDSKFIIHTNFS